MVSKEAPDYSIVGREVDLDSEVILDNKGRRVDQAYVDQAYVDLALAEVDEDLSRRWDRPDR